jgi:hypothetical protein
MSSSLLFFVLLASGMGSALEPTPYKPQPIWTAWKLRVVKLLGLLDAATSTVPTGMLRQ